MASGPSVVVRVLGDLKGLSGAVDGAATKGAGAAGKLRSAFSGTLGALNQSGVLGPFSEALAGVDQALGQVSEHGRKMGTVMMGVGGTMAGVGVALSALGSKEKASHEQLKQAIENTGKSYDDYGKRIEAAGKHNERFGITTHTTNDALRILTQATKSPEKALQLLGTATDLAAAKHEDLTTAATQMGRAYNGAGKIFKEFGITAAPKVAAAMKAVQAATKGASAADEHAKKAKQSLADYLEIYNSKSKHTIADQQHLRDKMVAVADADAKARAAHVKLSAAQEANAKAARGTADNMAQLAKAVHGQAEKAADTFTGKLKAMGAGLEDAAAQFGEKFGPALTVGGTALAGLGGAMTATQAILGLFKSAQVASTAATEGMAVAEDSAAVSSWAMLGPILLVIGAIAALVLAGYVIYRNWKTIWKGMHAAVTFVWDWIKRNWPLLLAILLGPIGIAVALIVRNWDKIKAGIAAAYDWIRHNWPLLLAILTGPIGAAVLLIVRNWDTIKGAIRAVWDWIRTAFGQVYEWLTSPFRRAADAIRTAFGAVYDWIRGLPGRIADVFGRVQSILATPFQNAANTIQRLADSIVNFITGIPGRIAGALGSIGSGLKGALSHIPGASVIPGLATGGYITHEGLAYLHAGETVVPKIPTPSYGATVQPTSAAGSTAPSVWIENLTVRESLDVDTFLRRAAWAVQRERI
jgi:hypothetical protein